MFVLFIITNVEETKSGEVLKGKGVSNKIAKTGIHKVFF